LRWPSGRFDSMSNFFAAVPQYLAVSLRLTVEVVFSFGRPRLLFVGAIASEMNERKPGTESYRLSALGGGEAATRIASIQIEVVLQLHVHRHGLPVSFSRYESNQSSCGYCLLSQAKRKGPYRANVRHFA